MSSARDPLSRWFYSTIPAETGSHQAGLYESWRKNKVVPPPPKEWQSEAIRNLSDREFEDWLVKKKG